MAQVFGTWYNLTSTFESFSFTCGYCGHRVASRYGSSTNAQPRGEIRICPECNCATFFTDTTQTPGPLIGTTVRNIPQGVDTIYQEARICLAASAPTACVLCCRKILMHIAVDRGAEEHKNFFEYIEYLANHNYIPPGGRAWVDYIRTKGNQANHEIVIATEKEAESLLKLTETLLRITYELPGDIPE